MQTLSLSEEDRLSYENKGYYIARSVVDSHTIASLRQVLVDRSVALAKSGDYGGRQNLEVAAAQQPDALQPAQRLRKLNNLAEIPELWQGMYAHPAVMAHAEAILGPNILNKCCSAFMKPARVGGATPWHQDIALWRDDNSLALNAWMAIDPATRENGCLQVVPGSHQGPVVEHVTYADGLHPELPRELCTDVSVEHIELQPGDVVFWHAHLWHYSPPNTSTLDRIGVGAVWINPAQLPQARDFNNYRWALRHGEPLPFPAPRLFKCLDAEQLSRVAG